jgi:threonine synthase
MCAIFCVHDMMRLAALAAPFLTTQLLLKIAMTSYRTIEDYIGNTPLVRVERIAELGDNILLLKLEGNNPAGSVKDRPAISMIKHAQERGDIRPGDTLIEATSGNTGIALAMAATVRGYRIILIMPESASLERRALMKAFEGSGDGGCARSGAGDAAAG